LEPIIYAVIGIVIVGSNAVSWNLGRRVGSNDMLDFFHSLGINIVFEPEEDDIQDG